MKKYIVKITSIATENSRNFAGETSIGFYGKDQKLLSLKGDHHDKMNMSFDLSDYMIKEYGYNRKCDAMRSWIFKNPENTKYWQSEVEIIECEI